MIGGKLNYSLLSLSVAAALSAVPTLAVAQQEADDEITVTGSRIRRDADYQTPNPTTTVDSEYLRNLGITNIGDALQQNPTQVTKFSHTTTGSGSFFVGTMMANLRGLNPYFGTRTLTLVDSKRHVPTNQGGSVDLNFIPSVIVERMETVTGGASASYGSDAVTGVVNILLDKRMEGVKLELDYGVTGESDADNRHLGFGGGKSLFDGRGHVVVGYEHQTQTPVYDCNTARDWCSESRNTFTNSTSAPTTRNDFPAMVPSTVIIPGEPHVLIFSGLRSGTTPNGLISDRRPGTHYQFNDAGTSLVPYDVGEYSNVSATRSVVGGGGRPIFDQQTLMPNVERNIVYTHFEYDLTPSMQFSTDFSYGKVETQNRQAGPSTQTICIRPDNPYLLLLDQASRDYMTSAIGQQRNGPGNGEASCVSGGTARPWLQAGTNMTKDYRPQQFQGIRTEAEATRLVTGLTGDIGDEGLWTWDAYYQYGHATREQIADDYITTYRYAMAIDTVLNPLTGQPDCRVNTAAPGTAQQYYPLSYMNPFLAEGCKPINPFGQTMSAEAHDYAFDPLEEWNTIDQQVFAGGVSGQLWQGWGAGPLQAAAGLEYRIEEMENDTYKDRPQAYSFDTSVSFGTNWAGESNVTEGFFEVEMPLLTDKPLARSWTLNTAARRTRYENTELERSNGALSGVQNVTSWKMQSIWEPVEWFRLRGSKSRDIRAAGFRELFYVQLLQKGATNGRVTNNFNNNTTNDEALIVLSGEPNLRPEKADTTTFGMVFAPTGAAEGLQLSLDYYQIELNDGIIRGGGARVLENCYADWLASGGTKDALGNYISGDLNGQFCKLVTFLEENGTPNLHNVEELEAPYYNDQPYKMRGLDYSVSYQLDMSGGGVLDLRLLASRTLEQTIVVGTGRSERDIAGMVGTGGALADYAPAPDWSANLIVGYSKGPLRVTTRTSYTAQGFIDTVTPYIGPDDPRYNPLNVNSIINNVVPSHMTQDVNFSYEFERRGNPTELWMSINNLWDKDPPFSGGSTGGANGAFYDILGRTYKLGVRLNF